MKLGADGLPITTYDQNDVTELARVFTGWSYAVQSIDSGQVSGSVVNTDFEYRGEGRPAIYHPYLVEPMISFADNGKDIDHRKYVLYRDPNAKTVLGQTIPEGQTAEEDLAQVMTILANHPNTAPQNHILPEPSPIVRAVSGLVISCRPDHSWLGITLRFVP